METEIIKVGADATGAILEQEGILRAGALLKNGGLVAFPTETVYGLGGNALLPNAAKKIYAAKGRPSDNPLIVHIAELSDLERIAIEIPEAAYTLADRFWPGPLTMILKKSEAVPLETTGGLSTVAVRMPNHPVALALIRAGGGFVAAPSANTSGRPSPTKAAHVIEDLRGKIEVILDGGAVGIGLESTIIDLTEEQPTVLRPGYITLEALEDVIGPVQMDRGLITEDSKVAPKAPGMKYRHYAPKAEMTLIDGAPEDVISYIKELTAEQIAEGRTVGILAAEESISRYPQGLVLCIGSRADAEEIAQHLYDCLRQFDEEKVDVIYSECFSDAGIGQAIRNRLLKAAGHRVLRVP